MNARYYRVLYHPVSQGVCFSASVGAEKGEDGAQLLYLSSGREGAEGELCPASAKAEHLHLLILADLQPLTIKRAVDICRDAVVDTILIPRGENSAMLPDELSRKADVCIVEKRFEICISDFAVKVFATGEKAARTLILYIGSRGVGPQTEECVMNVKRCTPRFPCHLTVDAANLNCEMRCLLCTDFTQCKKHNRGDETYFVDGHLLPGTAKLSACMPELKEYLAEEWKTIRFVRLPQNEEDTPVRELLNIGTSGHQRYYIGSEDTEPSDIKAAACEDPFGTFISVGDKAGICISGCYAKR